MISLLRTGSNNQDFIALVRHLDAELAEIDGEDHSFYDQYNKINMIRHAVVAYRGNEAIGCGAIKEFSPGVMEVKRMYIMPQERGKGVATLILRELEAWAHELSYKKCVLETGKKQKDAVALYKKNGYRVIPNYGQYIGVDNSLCFEKQLE